MTPEQQLIRLYRQAASRLRRDITRAFRSGALGTATYRQRQLLMIVKRLDVLERTVLANFADPAVRVPYTLGVHAVDLAAGRSRSTLGFGGLHEYAIRALAQQLATRLIMATRLVGRRTDDAFRRVALEQVAIGIAAGDARRTVSKAIERRLIDEGVTDAMTGFVDRRGRRLQLDTYAEMVARTTTREAVSAGTEQRMRETGQRLVKISTHPGCCDVCLLIDGKTFHLTGLPVDGYEQLPLPVPAHPNCRHVMAPASDEASFLQALNSLVLAG